MIQELFPVLVDGTMIAHLAVAELEDESAGYRAICPGGQTITHRLRPVPEDATFVWCGNCRAYAERVGISLPRSR
jgi:hypothetical protein